MSLERALCWWFGCSPDQAALDVGYWPPPCTRCGCPDCSYGDLVGDTRHNRFMRPFRFWVLFGWVRSLFPAKCTDCGKRYGHHNDCLPF